MAQSPRTKEERVRHYFSMIHILEKGNGGMQYWVYLLDFVIKGGPAKVFNTKKRRNKYDPIKSIFLEAKTSGFMHLDLSKFKNHQKNLLCAMMAWDALFGLDTVKDAITVNAVSKFVRQLARDLDKDNANLIIGSLPLLIEKLEKLRLPLPALPQDATALCKFVQYNMVLPEGLRWAMGPLSTTFVDSYFLFTEAILLDIVYNIRNMKEFLLKTFNPPPKQRQPKKGPPVDISPKELIVDHILNNHGSLINLLIWNKVSMKKQGHSRRVRSGKVILKNTFMTDGFSLHLHGFNTANKKWDAKSKRVDVAELKVSFDRIMGIDLGETNTIGAVAVNSKDPLEIQEFIKTRKSYYEPFCKFKKWIKSKKSEDVILAESMMLNANSMDVDQLRGYLEARNGEIGKRIKGFYDGDGAKVTQSFRYKKWKMKCATQAEYDHTAQTICKMVDVNYGIKSEENIKELIVIGDGDFSNNPSSLHLKVSAFVQKKCAALGVTVAQVNEDYTSQTCPRCFEKAIKETMRQTKCSQCGMPYNRDLMAAHNMAIITEIVLSGKDRPKPFQHPPESC